jgi:nitrate/nitrite transporter NarK
VRRAQSPVPQLPVGGALADRVGGALVTFWNFVAFIAFYALCFVLTWAVYLRRSPAPLPGV